MEGAAKIRAALSVQPCEEGEGSRNRGTLWHVCGGLQVTLQAPSWQTRRIRSGTGGAGGEIFHGAGEKVKGVVGPPAPFCSVSGTPLPVLCRRGWLRDPLRLLI